MNIVKWLQSIGVGIVGAIYTYVQSLQASGEGVEALLTGLGLMLLTKALGWIIAKIGTPRA